MKNDQLLIDEFLSSHPDIAIDSINDLNTVDAALLLEGLSIDQCLLILSRMVPYKAGEILEKVSPEHAVQVVGRMPLSLAESILRVCEKAVSDHILDNIAPEQAKYIRRALEFNKDQVGAHLDPYVFTLQVTMSVERALELIKNSKVAIKPHVFVLNKENILVGYIDVTDLVKNQLGIGINTLMKPVSHSVFAEMSVKDLLDKWNDSFTDQAVVKINGEFLGTVSKASLTELNTDKSAWNNSALKAGNALGELYTIGLTSLLGSAESNLKS